MCDEEFFFFEGNVWWRLCFAKDKKTGNKKIKRIKEYHMYLMCVFF
jgi:hypothetical protein